jgi:hypothetical protein
MHFIEKPYRLGMKTSPIIIYGQSTGQVYRAIPLAIRFTIILSHENLILYMIMHIYTRNL